MFPSTLLLALVAAHSILITAASQPGPQNAAAPEPTSILYTITSATIKQYSGALPNGTSKLRRRRDPPVQPPALPPPAATIGSSTTITTGGASIPTPVMQHAPAPDDNGDANSAAAAAYPIWTPLDPQMENFNLTLVPGAVQDNNPPIYCNLTWNAGEANGPTRDSIVSKSFSCTGGQTAVRMERRDVTPDYGFYIFVQVGGTPQAAWMVKDLLHSPGWNVTLNADTFQGEAPLTDVPHQTLADFLTN